jgi:hypothetical protein
MYTHQMSNRLKYLRFLDTLVCVRVSFRDGSDRTSVLEHVARRADSPPLHLHVNEDEIFHILEGNFGSKWEPKNGTVRLCDSWPRLVIDVVEDASRNCFDELLPKGTRARLKRAIPKAVSQGAVN